MTTERTRQLADAATVGDADAVRRLLSADPELAAGYTEDGWSMLHLASTPEIAA